MFPTNIGKKIWNSCRLLLVPINNEAYNIPSLLNQYNITFVDKNTEDIKFDKKYLCSLTEKKYNEKKELFFYDESLSYEIFYLINIQDKIFSNLCYELKDNNIPFKTDNGKTRSYLPLIFTLVSLIIFSYFAKDFTFFIKLLPFVIFNFSIPFWPQCILCVLFFYMFYIYYKSYKRKGFIKLLIKNIFVLSILIIFIIINIFTSLKAFLYGFITFICCFSIIFLCDNIKSLFTSSKYHQFEPILIFNAKKNFKVTYKNILLIIIPIVVSLFALIFSANVVIFPEGKNQSLLSIPCPVGYNTNSVLPNLHDFIDAIWNSFTMPFKSVNTNNALDVKPQIGDEVYFSEYKFVENTLTKTDVLVYKFSQNFIDEILKIVNNSSWSIEKILLNESDFCNVGYKKYSTNIQDNYSLQKIISLLVLMFLYLVYSLIIWRKDGKK